MGLNPYTESLIIVVSLNVIFIIAGFCAEHVTVSPPSAQQDAVFELVSMAFNVAVWYTKFASRLAGKEKYVLPVSVCVFIHVKQVIYCLILDLYFSYVTFLCYYTKYLLLLCLPVQ